VPAAVGLFLLAPVATEVMLGWASDVDPGLVGATLQALAIGVVPWLVISLLVRALYARGATARPFVLNLFAFVVFAGVGVGLTALREPHGDGAMRLVGSAIASGWWIAALLGVAMLTRLARGWSIAEAVRPVVANVVRAGLMGLAVWGVLRVLEGVAPDVVTLVVAVLVGVAVVALTAFRSRELRGTLAFLGGRVQTRTTGDALRATPSDDGRD
jgi:peptidoglycan biosynthesis protein MviN/MurJ (putative lipid II flippase)